MASDHRRIDLFPTEVLAAILSPLPTPSLLSLATVCRRFHAVVLSLLHRRLVEAVGLPGHELIFEGYHPSAQHSTPYLLCRYLGTDGLDRPRGGSASQAAWIPGSGEFLSLGEMRGLYSRFRLVPQEENRRPRARYPRRSAVPGSATAAGPSAETAPLPEPVTHDVHLDEHELFSQLCTVSNLARVGPKRGLYWSCVNISEGVIRIWRDWLARASDVATAVTTGGAGARDPEEAVLWADTGRNIGLRFRVRETTDARRPLLVGRDEEPPVSYRLEYQELLVRSTSLLLTLENSRSLKVADSGNDIVFV